MIEDRFCIVEGCLVMKKVLIGEKVLKNYKKFIKKRKKSEKTRKMGSQGVLGGYTPKHQENGQKRAKKRCFSRFS